MSKAKNPNPGFNSLIMPTMSQSRHQFYEEEDLGDYDYPDQSVPDAKLDNILDKINRMPSPDYDEEEYDQFEAKRLRAEAQAHKLEEDARRRKDLNDARKPKVVVPEPMKGEDLPPMDSTSPSQQNQAIPWERMETPEAKYKSRVKDDIEMRSVYEKKEPFNNGSTNNSKAELMSNRIDSVDSQRKRVGSDESEEVELTPGQKILKQLGHLAVESIKQTIMIGVILAYATAGAFAFQLLEQHNEQRSCMESKGSDIYNVVTTKAKLIEYVQYNITSNPLDTTKDNETYAIQRIEEMLTEYRDKVLEIGYDGSDCSDTKWIPINGILFCLTVVTTIGYGHVFPVTWEGQIFCICYATIGIPLFLMCTANISTVLSFLFRWSYVKVCCGICNYRDRKKKEREADESGEVVQSKAQVIAGKENVNGSQTRIIDDNEDLENEINDKDDIDNVSVPLTVTILVITGYIMIGAVIFHFFEGWTVIESAYFCFVTLSTIGFGDFTPGQNFDDPLLTLKLGVGCLYILLGLAILAMSFDLMQEEIISKFSWFGKKVGLIDPDEDEDEEENEKSSASKEKSKESLKAESET